MSGGRREGEEKWGFQEGRTWGVLISSSHRQYAQTTKGTGKGTRTWALATWHTSKKIHMQLGLWRFLQPQWSLACFLHRENIGSSEQAPYFNLKNPTKWVEDFRWKNKNPFKNFRERSTSLVLAHSHYWLIRHWHLAHLATWLLAHLGDPTESGLALTFGQQRPLHHIRTEGLPVPMAEVSQLLLLTQSDDYLEAGGPKRNSD